MKDTYNLSEFRSFRRARRIVGAATMLLALTLAGAPRLCASSCSQQDSHSVVAGVTLIPSSVYGGTGVKLTATISVAPTLTGFFPLDVPVGVGGVSASFTSYLYYGTAVVPLCQDTATAQFYVAAVTVPTPATFTAFTSAGTRSVKFWVLPIGVLKSDSPKGARAVDPRERVAISKQMLVAPH